MFNVKLSGELEALDQEEKIAALLATLDGVLCIHKRYWIFVQRLEKSLVEMIDSMPQKEYAQLRDIFNVILNEARKLETEEKITTH